MSPSQAVGYSMAQASAITAIVGARIYNGTRPTGTTGTVLVPCINYFEMPGTVRQFGIERASFSINCRAATAEVASSLARKVIDLFHGTSGTGVYGEQNNFAVTRCSLKQAQGLIPETAENIYNAPVDILIVYPTSTVS